MAFLVRGLCSHSSISVGSRERRHGFRIQTPRIERDCSSIGNGQLPQGRYGLGDAMEMEKYVGSGYTVEHD